MRLSEEADELVAGPLFSQDTLFILKGYRVVGFKSEETPLFCFLLPRTGQILHVQLRFCIHIQLRPRN
jgi:hypothetical protein